MQGKMNISPDLLLAFLHADCRFWHAKDLKDDKCYTSSGGLIPIKWTAIEVS